MQNIQTSKRLGRGAFTTAYLTLDNRVLLKSVDPMKECYALFCQGNPLIAPIETAGYCQRTNKPQYLMDYFAPTRALKRDLKPAEYAFYTQLVGMFKQFNCCSYSAIYEAVRQTEMELRKREQFLDIVDSCANYANESLCFEISPRNVRAVNGNLILLDCFFCKDLLTIFRNRKRQKYDQLYA